MRVIDTLTGLVILVFRALRAPGGPRGAYWTWRWQTAFGGGTPTKPELLRGLLHFAAWTRRMGRIR